jgi:hypothetical protein
MSCFDLAREAVMALRAYVEQTPAPKRDYPIETQLVVRETTGFPRGTMLHLRKDGRSAKSIRLAN